MYKNLAGRAVLAWVAACCLSPAFSQTSQVPQAPGKPPLKIGFVYVTPVTDAGWVRQHEEGRKAVDAALGDKVKTTYVENVAEGADAERVIRDLAQQGNTLIFTPSFGYMEPTLKVAKDFPDVSSSNRSRATRRRPTWRPPTRATTRAATSRASRPAA
jgi:basic membrane protein A